MHICDKFDYGQNVNKITKKGLGLIYSIYRFCFNLYRQNVDKFII